MQSVLVYIILCLKTITVYWFIDYHDFPVTEIYIFIYKKIDHKILWLHWSCMLVPFMLSAYMIQTALLLVVPIMGRSGSGNHAESVMSLITSAMFILVYSFYVRIIQYNIKLCIIIILNISVFFFQNPLVLLIQKVYTVFCTLAIVLLVSFLVLVFTPLGFPYSGDPNNLAPQRFMVAVSVIYVNVIFIKQDQLY